MSQPPTGPGGHDPADDALRALDGPADEDLVFSGPGDADPRLLADPSLPGGVDHTTAAVGAGSIGLVALGIAGAFQRRRDRRRRATLDE
jgi:hypothetical protein